MTHYIVVGLGFGDEGKGAVVDRLCGSGSVHTVVRYNGGCQAAHNVITPDGRHHTFAQFGAGSFNPGVKTLLSRYMYVEPFSLLKEAKHLMSIGEKDILTRIYIDGEAPLTTPYHWIANKHRNNNNDQSCGRGIGETTEYLLEHPDAAPRIWDVYNPTLLEEKLEILRDWAKKRVPVDESWVDYPPHKLVDTYAGILRGMVVPNSFLNELLIDGDVVFEGAQGVLLDEDWGFHPYNSWTNTTTANAETLLMECNSSAIKLGVLRTYMTRHGAGPFITESFISSMPDEVHNKAWEWQGRWRIGYPDFVANEYALRAVGGVDELILTHMDKQHLIDRACLYYIVNNEDWDVIPDKADLGGVLTSQLMNANPHYVHYKDSIADVFEDHLGVSCRPFFLEDSVAV